MNRRTEMQNISSDNNSEVIQLEISGTTDSDSGGNSNNTTTVAVPLAAVKRSEFYTSYLTQFNMPKSVLFPVDYNHVAGSYINYLNSQQEMSTAELTSALQLANLLDDKGYLKHLVKNVLLLNWNQYGAVIGQLHEELQTDLVSDLPLSLIPNEQLAHSLTFSHRWIATNALRGEETLLLLQPQITVTQPGITSVTQPPIVQITSFIPIATGQPAVSYSYTVAITANDIGHSIREQSSDGNILFREWDNNTIITESHITFSHQYVKHGLVQDVQSRQSRKPEHGLNRRWYSLAMLQQQLPDSSLLQEPSQPPKVVKPQLEEEYSTVNGGWEGLYRSWYRSGNKRSEIPYSLSMVHGISRKWYDNIANSPEEEIGYHNGQYSKHGIYRLWNEAGIMTVEGHYDNSQQHGEWREWDNNGGLYYFVTYDHDQLVAVHVDTHSVTKTSRRVSVQCII